MTPGAIRAGVGHIAAHVATRRISRFRLGYALFRDRRVSALTKLFALASGGLLTLAVVVLELPIEAIVTAFMPILGIPIDMLFDGAELLALPVLFGMLLLPSLAPASIVADYRRR